MINFRYHIVSLAAVFVALAVGAVFGTAAANGVATDVLSDSISAAHKTNDQLRQTTEDLQVEASRKDDYINDTAPAVLGGTLDNRRIVVLTTPSGRDHAQGVIDKLRVAGAAVTGPVDVREAFFDPRNNLGLLELARGSAASSALPGNSNGAETASALLAAVLLAAPSDVDASAVVSAYARAGYLTAPERLDGPADGAVLVTGAPYVTQEPTKRNAAIVTMAAQFAMVGSTVVAGTGAGDGSALGTVRGDEALTARISTTDGVAGAQGQVVTALALVERITANRGGHYGTADGADALTPRRP
ncbi:copper transporter [Micromonospora zingiberis]|uniref:copper transporter n=1 Tax=Micromonospora zingiberis TaxID=2053011 RepID=UPI0013F3F99D|nr:copper transporter [Micromonospora zingiberis]